MHSKKLVVFDVSLLSDNIGDEIIMEFSNKEISKLFHGFDIIRVPTHVVPEEGTLNKFDNNDLKIICGTNILCPSVKQYNLWKMPSGLERYRNLVTLSVGMNYYGSFDEYSANMYKSLFSSGIVLSVRDSDTLRNLNSIGIHNVINTNCISLWGLTKEKLGEIPKKKGNSVVFSLTAHRPDQERDIRLVKLLRQQYKKIYFWPQGINDLKYLSSIIEINDDILVLDRSLENYRFLLKHEDVDYVGTRLHGGIYALNFGRRAFIIIVDNRSESIQKDTNLPCYYREDLEGKMLSDINGEYEPNIILNYDEIRRWENSILQNLM